jgi:hypothetical protein
METLQLFDQSIGPFAQLIIVLLFLVVTLGVFIALEVRNTSENRKKRREIYDSTKLRS